MIIDASSISTDEVIDADLCVIGAGPAGLTVAHKLIGSGHRVYLLESGDERIDDRSQELADGDVIGHPYFALSEARGVAVGGSSHLWDEWMRARPLDPIDFDRRSWVPGSGWPFSRDELEPYYREAHGVLGLGEYDYSVPQPVREALTSEGWGVDPVSFRYSNTFDFERTRGEIAASSNVCLVVNATAIELEETDVGSCIQRIVASSGNPQRFGVASRVFVLAAGGIDTPRLMLASRSRSSAGVGNSSGMVGASFMEHPTMRSGVVVPGDKDLPTDFFTFRPGRVGIKGSLAPTEEAMEAHAMLNCMVMLTASDDVRGSELVRSLAMVRDGLRGANASGESTLGHLLNALSRPREAVKLVSRGPLYKPRPRLRISVTVEQAPNPASRVVLSRRTDRFGLPLPALDWRLGDQERHTVRKMQELIDLLLGDRGLGRVERMLGEERPPRRFRGEWHQLGTTRMSSSRRLGVVDPHGRAHDIENLYIAGGSVFPAVGYANPTLTIVALSLRLARRLEKVLARGVSLGPIW